MRQTKNWNDHDLIVYTKPDIELHLFDFFE